MTTLVSCAGERRATITSQVHSGRVEAGRLVGWQMKPPEAATWAGQKARHEIGIVRSIQDVAQPYLLHDVGGHLLQIAAVARGDHGRIEYRDKVRVALGADDDCTAREREQARNQAGALRARVKPMQRA